MTKRVWISGVFFLAAVAAVLFFCGTLMPAVGAIGPCQVIS
jgi:hypothetical protein